MRAHRRARPGLGQKYLPRCGRSSWSSPTTATLFLDHDGEPLRPAWLTRRWCAATSTQPGIGKHGACHLFRHTMATLMLEGGADIRFIQEMLGHADLQTTQIYTRVSIQKLKAIHAATHPAAKLERPVSEPAPTAEDETPKELLSALAAEAAGEE